MEEQRPPPLMCSCVICHLVSRHVSGPPPAPCYGSLPNTAERQSLGHPSWNRNGLWSTPLSPRLIACPGFPAAPRDYGCPAQRPSLWPECPRVRIRQYLLLRDPKRRIKVLVVQTAMLPGHNMTSKKTLNARNLEALGAEHLAELQIEISKKRPAARRLLRLELVGAQGTAETAREVRHRMATIRRSRAVIDSRRRRHLVDHLELCRRTIVDRIAVENAAEALDLIWQYMGLESTCGSSRSAQHSRIPRFRRRPATPTSPAIPSSRQSPASRTASTLISRSRDNAPTIVCHL